MLTTQEGPKIVQAASLALTIMKKTKQPWSVTKDRLPVGVILSDEQVALLQQFSEQLELVVPTQAEGAEATTTIYACTECGRWGYISSGAAPKKCTLSLWCEGEVVKASAAKKYDG